MTATPKTLSPDVIDTLLLNYQKPEDLIGENGLLKQLTKALVERALEVEMTEHLGHRRMNLFQIKLATPAMVKVKKSLKVSLVKFP